MIKFVTDDGKEFEKIEDAEKYEKDLEVKKTSREKDKKELQDALSKYLELKKKYDKKYKDVNENFNFFTFDDFDDFLNHFHNYFF